MSYADLFVGILIIVLVIIAAVQALKPKAEAGGRDSERDDKGK
jgi:hypothetical protein